MMVHGLNSRELDWVAMRPRRRSHKRLRPLGVQGEHELMQLGRQRQLQASQYDAVRGAQHRRGHGRDDCLGGDAELPGGVEATEARHDVRVGDEEVLGHQRDVGVHGGVGLGL